jgi:hypothetical protein
MSKTSDEKRRLLRSIRDVSSGRVPLVARRDVPLSMAGPVPIRARDNLLLRGNECRNGTHPMRVFGASLDTCKRCDGVIYYDTKLFALSRGTGKHCRTPSVILSIAE